MGYSLLFIIFSTQPAVHNPQSTTRSPSPERNYLAYGGKDNFAVQPASATVPKGSPNPEFCRDQVLAFRGPHTLSLCGENFFVPASDGNFKHETFSRSPPWQLDLASGVSYSTASSETECRHLPLYMCSNRRRYFGCSIEFVGRDLNVSSTDILTEVGGLDSVATTYPAFSGFRCVHRLSISRPCFVLG
ncbi:hypothetical protein PCH_Pc22g15330 [Penicillium rubens Wisconsin 54-1255]|uniref:Uncharacterized protein n=1 Tax=Penicillium rubens (strain ATCC 28089 / DSM 1075 / NRRL 1951 / Wisconsin 54-1255) TaxID=500485 RepID=B6HVZ1_PENRW|nr:hypothetical protein PCH_Pc22g15330 [Penicillium rubens Wisconsin 54-1255]